MGNLGQEIMHFSYTTAEYHVRMLHHGLDLMFASVLQYSNETLSAQALSNKKPKWDRVPVASSIPISTTRETFYWYLTFILFVIC